MFAEILPGIYSVSHQVADGKNAIIFGTRGALVIDVCLTQEEGQAVAAFVRAQGCQPDRVLLTHGHSDHVLGGQAFQGAEVYASVDTPAVTRSHLKEYAEKKGLSYELLLEQALAPTVMFSDEFIIDMGNRRIRTVSTPGHSADHHSVYLEAERLLVAGDAVVTGIVPAIFDDSRKLEDSLRLLQTMDIEIMIPGHGEVVRGAANVQDWLVWIINYVVNVREFVARGLDASPAISPDELADAVGYDRFVGDRLQRDKFNMEGRHRTTVLKIIAEERERLHLP